MGKPASRAARSSRAADSKPAAPAIGGSGNVINHPLHRGMTDSLVNLVTGMGTGKDKATSTQFAFTELQKQQAEAAYRGDWMSRKVIDIPAYDATREWRTWQADKKDNTIISDLEEKLDLQRKFKGVLQRGRLYGGGALILGVDQGAPEDEVVFEKLGKDCLKWVHVVNRYEVTPGEIEWDVESAWFGQPKYYERSVPGTTGVRLHPSRVCRFVGAEIPDIQQSKGWGDSVLQIVADAVVATGTVFQSMTSLVQEAKVDVVKIPELSERISNAEYEDRLKTRFGMAAVMKSIYSVLLIDKEEEWERVNQIFTGMPELMQEFILMVCGAADIPATRYLGQAPKGLSATGDSDTRNYYDRVSTEQRIEITPIVTPLDRLMQISAFGKEPDGMWYNWNPLWQMTEVEKADIAVKQSVVMTADVTAALMDPMVLQKARENQLIESGFYPGIEIIIEQFGTDISERMPAPGAGAAMIDPQTGKPPDVNDPAAVARAIPDPNAPPAPAPGGAPAPAAGNVLPFGKKPPAGTPKKKVAGVDEAIESMALRIRDAELIDASTPRTLYVYRPVLNWRDIAKFYKGLGVQNVYGSDMHVTICYSKKPVDWLKVGEDYFGGGSDDGRLTVKAGGPRVNEQFNKHMVLAFASSDLSYRHRSILERTDGTWEYDDYTPHVSISKDPGAVNPLTMDAYQGPIVFGPEVFEEVKVDGAEYDQPKETLDDSVPAPAPAPAPIIMPAPIVHVDVKIDRQGKVIKTVEHDSAGRVSRITETPSEE